MVSMDLPQSARAIVASLALIAAPSASGAPAEVDFEPAATAQQQQMLDSIQDELERNGPFSADLIGPVTALALSYQEDGDHSLAAVANERALQLVRVNYGLHSLDQAPVLRQAVRNEEERGNVEGAWEIEQDLLALARRHPNDLRTVPILHEIADKRMATLARYTGGEFPPQVYLGCYYQPVPSIDRNCRAGSKSVAIRSMLAEASRYYMRAVATVLRHGLYGREDLHEIEMGLVRISYRFGDRRFGEQSLRRLIAYDAANSEPWLARIDGWVRLADWGLLFADSGNSNQAAFDMYEQAYALLEEKGVAQASIDEFFAPEIPVMLPSFEPAPFVSVQTSAATGYVDAAFEITQYGRSKRTRILASTTNATHADKARVVRLIASNRFRPRAVGGLFAAESSVAVRYVLSE